MGVTFVTAHGEYYINVVCDVCNKLLYAKTSVRNNSLDSLIYASRIYYEHIREEGAYLDDPLNGIHFLPNQIRDKKEAISLISDMVSDRILQCETAKKEYKTESFKNLEDNRIEKLENLLQYVKARLT